MSEVRSVIEDVLMEPLEDVLFHIGRGIAQSQLELDKNSLATQVLIDDNKDSSESGTKAPWYCFPEVNAELKMNLSLQGMVEEKGGKVQAVRLQIFSAPINATYKNTFDYDVAGTSTIKVKIVSIPPPIEVKGT